MSASATNSSQVPDWLKAEIFTELLETNVAEYLKTKSFKVNAGTTAGENYQTLMLRIEIEVELKDGSIKPISYMIKLPHQRELFQRSNIFDTECNIYENIIPELEKLYHDVGVDIKFGPRYYKLKEAVGNYVLLEDLRPQNFKNVNRLEGLDQKHTENVLEKMAQWHAASVVRVANKGSYPEAMISGLYKEANRPMLDMINRGLSAKFMKCCATYEGKDEYFEQVKNLQPHLTNEMMGMGKIDPNELNVLNHGDCWSNNIMFQYDSSSDTIKDTYFVDFQLSKYANVANDLVYFLLSSTKLEDKISKFDHYIKYYHDKIVENLKLLKYTKPLPTLRELHMTILRHGTYGYSVATGVMGFVLLDPKDSGSLANLLKPSEPGDDTLCPLHANPRYRKHIALVLPWLLNRGALAKS
ncbi:uncharacterized protein [Drosophila tropicalis]|uniref:uncharacterized protein n=1 Tax=Drosophila tropicalis TaxID=46794 RepID=UPI0035AB8B5E